MIKMVLKWPYEIISVFFLRFSFKILELFECGQGDLYMTGNRNFGRLAHPLRVSEAINHITLMIYRRVWNSLSTNNGKEEMIIALQLQQ